MILLRSWKLGEPFLRGDDPLEPAELDLNPERAEDDREDAKEDWEDDDEWSEADVEDDEEKDADDKGERRELLNFFLDEIFFFEWRGDDDLIKEDKSEQIIKKWI